MDNGYENPIFATLEVNYADAASDPTGKKIAQAKKMLTYYELDLGLNHVSRRWTSPVARLANKIVALPGGTNGPSGVLVASHNTISYHNEGQKKSVELTLPKRIHNPEDRPPIISTMTVHRQKKNKFFALIQTEFGDVFKISVKSDKPTADGSSPQVTELIAELLDTIPTTTALNVTKKGLLFAASEFGDHALYQFDRIDLSSVPARNSSKNANGANGKGKTPVFTPSSTLTNLHLVSSSKSLTPATSLLLGEYAGGEISPQLYVGCGRGGRSSLRVLRHGASVKEFAASELPGRPSAIFTIKNDDNDNDGQHSDDSDSDDENDGPTDKYIVVSFTDATLVLSIGDTVEEISGKDSGFLTDVQTICAGALGNSQGYVQVHPNGVRHIRSSTHQPKEWLCPGLKRIQTAAINDNQVAVALAGGEVIYFVMDSESGVLTEVDNGTKDLDSEITCLCFSPRKKGHLNSDYMAVGTKDNTVRILSLTSRNNSLLTTKSSQSLKTQPTSLSLQSMLGEKNQFDTYLTVGLSNGSVLSTKMDDSTGSLSNTPTLKFLGSRPVKVHNVVTEGKNCVLLLSSRSWILHPAPSGKHQISPLSYSSLDHAVMFNSPGIQGGIVATANETFRIIQIEDVDQPFSQVKVPLRYTPRQTCLINNMIAVVEADHNELSEDKKKEKADFQTSGGNNSNENMMEDGSDSDSDDETANKKTFVRGPLPEVKGTWGSCIRLLDPKQNGDCVDVVELEDNCAALSACAVHFHSKSSEVLLAVGVTQSMKMHPVSSEQNFVDLYRIVDNRLTFIYRTKVDGGIVMAMTQFQGKLLCAVGPYLRLYEMGAKQLLRKCELRAASPNSVFKTLDACGDRIFAGDMHSSMKLLKYDPALNRMAVVCDDLMPRAMVASQILDFGTVAGSDKFGNFFVLRAPKDVDNEAVGTGARALWDMGRNEGHKFECLCHFHVGEIVTGMKRGTLIPGGTEGVIYTTISGRIGAFLPLTNKDDVEFYQGLESSMRLQVPKPVGFEPVAFRSSFVPVKHVIDGELLELYGELKADEQNKIADKLDRTVEEVSKKLVSMTSGLI